jgi:hypothetical protein
VKAAAKAAAAEAAAEAAAAVAQDTAGGVRADVTSSGQRTGKYFPLQSHSMLPRRQRVEPPLRRAQAQGPYDGYGFDFDFEDDEYAAAFTGGFEDDLGRFYPHGPDGGFTGRYAMGSYCPPIDDDSIPLEDEGGNPLPAAERAALRARKAEVKRIKDEATAASGGRKSGGGGGGGGGGATAGSAESYMYIRL